MKLLLGYRKLYTIASLLYITVVCNHTAYCQHEADNWFFGRRVGISFIDGDPVPIYGSPINQVEGTAVVSDSSSGRLLFYTNGLAVWNATHQVMENGLGLLGSGTSTQSALIVPFPERPGFYYLFTTRSYSDNSGGLNYSVVEVAGSNGQGSVVENQKNILMERFGSEKLTAIPHANQKDYWIISHRYDSDVFLVYSLTRTGISPANEINIGDVHKKAVTDGSGGGEMGALKASPDGKHLACAVYGNKVPFQLFDFDSRTGVISSYRSLGNFSGQYGVSFSPDNKKLYLSGLADEGFYQFDLNNLGKDPYKVTLSGSNEQEKSSVGGSMQLGPNGKLYIASIDRENLLVLNHPNDDGPGIYVEPLYLNLKDGKILEGLPNLIQSTFNTSPVPPYNEPDNCKLDIQVFPNPALDDYVDVNIHGLSQDITCKLQSFKVYDIAGREFVNVAGDFKGSLKVNTRNWSSGMYIFVFNFDNVKIVKKFFKI